MAKLPFRRKKTPAQRALGTLRSVLKIWVGTRAASVGGRLVARTAGRRLPSLRLLLGLLGIGGAAFAASKRLPGGGESTGASPSYAPPTPSTPTSPVLDPHDREPPHGDVAADLLKGDPRDAAPGGRNVGTSGTAPSTEPPGTTGTGGEGTSAPAPPAGTGGTSTGSPSDMPGGSTRQDDAPRTIAPGTPAGQSPGGDVPPLSGPSGEDEVPFVSPERGVDAATSPAEDDAPKTIAPGAPAGQSPGGDVPPMTGSAPQEGTDDVKPPPSSPPPPTT